MALAEVAEVLDVEEGPATMRTSTTARPDTADMKTRRKKSMIALLAVDPEEDEVALKESAGAAVSDAETVENDVETEVSGVEIVASDAVNAEENAGVNEESDVVAEATEDTTKTVLPDVAIDAEEAEDPRNKQPLSHNYPTHLHQ